MVVEGAVAKPEPQSNGLPGYDGVVMLPMNDQIKELQTIIRDASTSPSDFLFYADRLVRLVVEESLNLLPYSPWIVETPTSNFYEGVRFSTGNCGVSIVRSGEVMEKGLRECCRSMRIGKILILKDHDSGDVKVMYAKLIADIAKRNVLLLYPVMNSGKTVAKAIEILKSHGVPVTNIILVNLFCTPNSLVVLHDQFADLRIVTSECDAEPPNYFCEKYFGTSM
uniref:Uracil phosphoribosyltransferase n=1 Tax=Trichuris muris TaxID=70415 RepID=A0A5S6QHY3_TRIMR